MKDLYKTYNRQRLQHCSLLLTFIMTGTTRLSLPVIPSVYVHESSVGVATAKAVSSAYIISPILCNLYGDCKNIAGVGHRLSIAPHCQTRGGYLQTSRLNK